MEILTAFVRENAPKIKEQDKAKNVQDKPKNRKDIQASITAIERRNCKNDRENAG